MIRRTSAHSAKGSFGKDRAAGFSLLELVGVVAIGLITTVMAIPVWTRAMANAHINASVNAISTAVSQTRYAAVMNSQIYTLTLSAPADTYVVTDVSTNVSARAVPLPNPPVAINGGSTATFTYTFCPNGTVWGAGGACSGNLPQPPALSVVYQTRQVNMNVSTVGNVTTQIIR